MENLKLIPKPPHGSEEWLRLRWRDENGKCVFGASDAAALMNASPYNSRADLFIAKRNEPEVGVETEAFRRGNLLEPVLLEEASRKLGLPITTPQVMYSRGRFTVSLDGVDNEEDPSIVVEAKTTTRYGVRSQEDLPMEWLWQGWAQSFVLPNATVMFCVFDRDQRFSLIPLPSNPTAMTALEGEASRFAEMVDSGEDWSGSLADFTADHIAQLWQPTPEHVDLPPEAAEWLALLEQAKSDEVYAKQQKERATDELARLLLGREVGMLHGQKVVTWKVQSGRKSLDAKALQEAHPEIYAQFLKEGAPFRTMRIVRAKK